MKVPELLLAACVLSLGTFVGYAAFTTTPDKLSVAATGSLYGTLSRASGNISSPTAGSTSNFAIALPAAIEPSELRRKVSQSIAGTYLDELLAARDSALARWPERTVRPLRVWVERPQLEGWSEDYVTAVQSAFDSWEETGVPVHFSFVTDSVGSDVRVRFRTSFSSGISGKTVWSRDARWWLLSGDIELALLHPNGGYVDVVQMRAIAMHEVGHLLGLDHTESSDNIMASRVRTRELSEQDRATIRALYSMPAGTLRD